MNVIFVKSESTAKSIRTFWFKPPSPVHYTAGQFIELRLPHPKPDNRGEKRWFTLSSSPTEPLLSITTKLSEPGSTFKKTLFGLKPGKQVHMSDPMGDFVLPKDTSIPLLFVAGGIGITPVHSMIKWLSDSNEKRQVSIIYVAASKEEFAFTELFRAYGAKVTMFSSDQDDTKAHLSAQSIVDLAQPTTQTQIYLSGPEPMIENIVAQFEELGYDQHRLITDYFPGYTPI